LSVGDGTVEVGGGEFDGAQQDGGATRIEVAAGDGVSGLVDGGLNVFPAIKDRKGAGELARRSLADELGAEVKETELFALDGEGAAEVAVGLESFAGSCFRHGSFSRKIKIGKNQKTNGLGRGVVT
jgi:hypothetical protein